MNSLCARIGFITLGSMILLVATFTTDAFVNPCCNSLNPRPPTTYTVGPRGEARGAWPDRPLVCACGLSIFGVRLYQALGVFLLAVPLAAIYWPQPLLAERTKRNAHSILNATAAATNNAALRSAVLVFALLLIHAAILFFMLPFVGRADPHPTVATTSNWTPTLTILAVLQVLAIGAGGQNVAGEILAVLTNTDGGESEMC